MQGNAKSQWNDFVPVLFFVLECRIAASFLAMAVMALGMPILAISRQKFAPKRYDCFGSVRAANRNAMLSGLTTLGLLRLSTLPPLMRWLELRSSQQLKASSLGLRADLGTDLERLFAQSAN
jgi:hypothetical protein